MSFYKLSDGPLGGLDLDSVYYDINMDVVEDGGDGAIYGDLEVVNRPFVSGSGVIIAPGNGGIPDIEDYIINPDGSKSLKSFLSSSPGASPFTETENNGRMGDINVIGDVGEDNYDVIIKKDNNSTSIKGILEQNSINDIFFGEMNMDVLQGTIRYKVHENTSMVISNQSENEIYIIMRSIMLQYANFRVGIDEIGDEIKRLNAMVIDYCVGNISSNVLQHKGYVDDIGTLRQPFDRPTYTLNKNYTYDMSNIL
jgi:hypothetical protein